ncbi:MAG: hypothetical protein QNJ60_13890, partial [Xenococcaceae cyanobacterium MO_188.B19]|nr:hypothetical protein [Xenococcaceae cyanobacterium MO_188.B19]
GNAGDIFLEVSENIRLSGEQSGIFASTATDSEGTGGSISTQNFTPKRIIIQEGAAIAVNSQGTGIAGSINLKTAELTLDNGSINLSTAVEGDAGNLTITTPNLTLSNGGNITAQTSGTGKAGDIFLEVSEKINLSGNGSGIFASTESGSKGQGGSILTQNATPKTIIVKDGATIEVNSQGEGEGGNITLKAANLNLDNGSITAETASTKGGNITLALSHLLTLQDNSQISATAGTQQAGGDGGNVTINSPFILAFPTSNSHKITARAFTGNGGEINITTLGLFGFGTSFLDIDASSTGGGIDGIESIKILEVDPAQSLNQLPTNIVDASRLIAKSCLAGDEENEFVVTGRGGLPTNPNELLKGDAVLSAEWVTLSDAAETLEVQDSHPDNRRVGNAHPTRKIVEAQGWIIAPNGNVILTAAPTPQAPNKLPWSIPYDCSK